MATDDSKPFATSAGLHWHEAIDESCNLSSGITEAFAYDSTNGISLLVPIIVYFVSSIVLGLRSDSSLSWTHATSVQ